MRRRIIAGVMVMSMMGTLLAGCDQAAKPAETTGLADTKTVDSAIENAAVVEDSSGYLYTGEAPITEDGGTIKIMAQESNYPNVDISKAPIVLKVFE